MAASTEARPITVSACGANANPSPATRRVHSEPIRSRRASATNPAYGTVSSSPHHKRWVTQPGTFTACATVKNGPMGKR